MRKPTWKPRPDLHFIELQTAVFCVSCERISRNCTPACLGCGSRAVLSLSCVLGGTLQREATANLVQDAGMDELVRQLLATVPLSPKWIHDAPPIAARNTEEAALSPEMLVSGPARLDLEPAISVLAERAQTLTRASGSAIGLRWGNEIVCSARAGRTAPDLGVRLQTESGLSGECVRSGQILCCDDAESHPAVDQASCRRLGVRSILVAPLRYFHKTLGIFEVLSSQAYAFDELAVANLQMLAGFMVAAIARAGGFSAAKSLS